ncbi:B3 DNA binding domain containing protein [Trema orientale]|uniref:B3 DNA binding domain containing protein n=1 Tax=Trema orientale TaxID=63057 RepID=A0A2P5FZH7_TREOI|nr:B3 DNA binding domain containing protein [Trema orientale]
MKNPSFMVILKPHNINYLYVPADFSKKYLRTSSELITLEAPNGDQCIVSCTCNASKPSSSSSAKRIIRGWCGFFRENDLEEGDVCVFELINRRNIVLKVWIYRVANYAGR